MADKSKNSFARSEIDGLLDDVKNQAQGREFGCLSMRSERALVAEIEHLRSALDEIHCVHLGDCPASMDEVKFAWAHNSRVRRIARTALLADGLNLQVLS